MSVRFGEFVFDPDTRQLTCDGEERHLSNKAFDLLDILISRSPNAITKLDLYDHLWGDIVVEEVNLANLISEVRSALGETARQHRFVKTIHGYGYAFNGPVLPSSSRKPIVTSHVYSLFWGRDELRLLEGRNVIGRADDADITIDSASVSRHHACVELSGTTAYLEDLESKNGTFLKGEKLRSRSALSDGDEIRLGRVPLVFRMIRRNASTVSVHRE